MCRMAGHPQPILNVSGKNTISDETFRGSSLSAIVVPLASSTATSGRRL